MSPDDQAVMAYYDSHFHDRMTDRAIKAADWQLLDAAGGVVGKDVLDLGCGYPHDMLRWGEDATSWTLVDWCPQVLMQSITLLILEEKGQNVVCETACVDMRAFPAEWPERFDVALCFGTLQLVSTGRDRVHAEVCRLLRPGGAYCLTVPNREYFGVTEVRGADVCGYMATWTAEQLTGELERAGFALHGMRDDGMHLRAWASKPGREPAPHPCVSAHEASTCEATSSTRWQGRRQRGRR